MTIFGPDISSYQAGLNLASLDAAAFVIAKCSEGTYYTDGAYQGWRLQAATLKQPFVWYHFLSGEDVTAQARHNLACVGDPGLPGMLDVEPTPSYTPTLAQTLDYIDAAHAAGLNLRLVYLPKWVHEQLGSPDLSGFTARGVKLVSSAYPGGNGSPEQLYPGDNAAGWQPYGGLTPVIYQYTNQALDAGKSLDYNAFKASATQLAAILNPTTSTPGDDDVTPQDKQDIINGVLTALAKTGPASHDDVVAVKHELDDVSRALGDVRDAVVSVKHELDDVARAVKAPVTP